MEFGKLLKQERKKMNLTQADLAEQLNVSRSAISNWEIGRNYPDIQTIIDISNVLGVSLDYLLNEDQKIMEAVDNDLTKKKKDKKDLCYFGWITISGYWDYHFSFISKKTYDKFC